MSKATQPIPAGLEHLIPHLVCSPCTEAIEFYKRRSGRRRLVACRRPMASAIMHAALRIGKSPLFLVERLPEFCGGKSGTATAHQGARRSRFHQYVENCDAAIKRAADAGAGCRCRRRHVLGRSLRHVIDPYGHQWSFATHQKDLTPAETQAAMKQEFAQHKG